MLCAVVVHAGDGLAGLARYFSHTTEWAQQAEHRQRLPLPPRLVDAYEFWIRVYSEWDSTQALLHRDRSFELKTDALGQVVLLDTRSDEVKRYSNVGERDRARSAGHKEYWRMQRGMRDLLLTAMQTYVYFQHPMEEALAKSGLPVEVLALGFLESLYTPDARSKTGAVGVFQIQPWEGHKLGARMGPAFNELLDPITSARLAADKLKTDLAALERTAREAGIEVQGQSLWPLAVTAYNQGVHLVIRAVQDTRSVDLLRVVIDDEASRFGFSGRNFYVQFRMFADLLRNSKADLARADWPRMDPLVEITVGRFLDWPGFIERCGLHPAWLKPMNLGITDLGWDGVLYLPPDAQVRFPRIQLERVQKCLQGPALGAMHEAQRNLTSYRLRKGDNLTTVAQRLGCTPFDLMAVNDIDREKAARMAVGTLVRVPTRRYAELAEQVESWAQRGRPRPLSFAPYTVRAGDDVEKVERIHGLKHPELAKWNDLTGWRPGLVVHVPEYAP